jgi:7,8-dihydropterin-6-yl-methyl-4-(beta-D-ribofuranosyl)aminobenzene 5'-phosphate synthase
MGRIDQQLGGTMIRITVLCENTVGNRFGIGEHGFSAYVELPEETLLFDTGGGKSIVPNALTFGKDLGAVSKILISHGHHDHTGGLPEVLGLLRGVEVWGHPEIFVERISQQTIGGTVYRRFVGIPHRRRNLELLGAQFQLDRSFRRVAHGAFLTGEVPRSTSFERGDPQLFIPEGDDFVPDPLLDDQSLVIHTEQGLVVVFGCAHAGMINTLRYAREKTGEERILAVLGGTHVGFLSQEQLEFSLEELKGMKPQMVAVSHCTGMKAACRLMQEFGERFTFANVGSGFEFPAKPV